MINTEGLSTYDYCHRRLFLYCRLNGYSKTNTYPVYRAILNQILKQFPEPERVGLIAIQEFASTFTNDNTRRNICIILRWLFNTVYNQNLDWRELPYPKKRKKVQPIYAKEDILKVLNSIYAQPKEHQDKITRILRKYYLGWEIISPPISTPSK